MIDPEKFRALLHAEKQQLEEELEKIAVREGDAWIPKPGDLDTEPSDKNEWADAVEEADEHIAVVAELNRRWKNVVRALKKIEEGTYGIDEIDGQPIEEERLRANPAARTRIANMDKEDTLPD